MLDRLFLPFTESELDNCLAHSTMPHLVGDEEPTHKYKKWDYVGSVQKCEQLRGNGTALTGMPLSKLKSPLQAEKDERIWTAGCLMRWVIRPRANATQWAELMRKAFSNFPLADQLRSWEACFDGEVRLVLEAPMPSPADYSNEWLPRRLVARNVVRYVVDSGTGRKGLEGPSQADAVIINEHNHFAIIVEAKVTADASCEISFDMMRNQIARMIEVMLEPPHKSTSGALLSQRDPLRSIFILLTPRILKENWRSRLYGWLMNDYMSPVTGPGALERDLTHCADGHGIDYWTGVSKRIGWLTWEDFNDTIPGTCPWLDWRK